MSSSASGFDFWGDEKFAEAVTKYGLSLVQIQALAIAAIEAKSRAYCQYSNFRVGAALLTKSTLAVTCVSSAPDPSSPPSKNGASAARASLEALSSSSDTAADQQQQHGQIIVGANIENCSYPVGTCAERAALATAVSMGHVPAATTATTAEREDGGEGGSWRRRGTGLSAIAVSADTEEPCSPCGMCRQFLRELVPADTPVFMFARRGNWAALTVGQLLPMSFGAADLRGGQGAGAAAVSAAAALAEVDTRTVAD